MDQTLLKRPLTRNLGYAICSNTGRPSSVIFIENSDANLYLYLLIFEIPRLQFGPDNRLPAPDLCFNSAALIIAAAGLPGHAATVLYLSNVSVSN